MTTTPDWRSTLRPITARTTRSLIDRVDEYGYAPTSLTGAYSGMFSRDASIQAMAFVRIGEVSLARRILGYIDRFVGDTVSHISPPPHSSNQTGAQDLADPAAFLEISGIKAVARQTFTVTEPITLTRLWIRLSGAADARARFTIRLRGNDDWSIEGYASLEAVGPSGWVGLQLPASLVMVENAEYEVELTTEGARHEIRWLASRSAAPSTPRPAEQYRQNLGGWIETSVYATLALNDEPLSTVVFDDILASGGSYTVQPDADAMYVLAHARVMRAEGYADTAEVTAMMRHLAKSLERDERTKLVINRNLEHSRRTHYLTAIDLVTNVFASQAYYELSEVATDDRIASAARREADVLADAIHQHLTFENEGSVGYAELIWLPFERQQIDGFSWVNLAPAAAKWFAVRDEIMAFTVERYRETSSSLWNGTSMLNVQDADEGVIGKGLAWEIAYFQSVGDVDRLAELAKFIVDHSGKGEFAEQYNRAFEADIGNQEHASWFVWAVADIAWSTV